MPGPKSFLRLKLILRFHHLLRRRIDPRLQRLLTAAVTTARRRFDGPVTYSAAGWEHVDWSLFDLVGVSLYNSRRNQATYTDGLRNLVRDHDKAGFGVVAVTEDGTSRPKEAFHEVARRYGDMADGAERDERSDHRG